jgi:sn-2 palmitoyl-lipid 9-desaturase
LKHKEDERNRYVPSPRVKIDWFGALAILVAHVIGLGGAAFTYTKAGLWTCIVTYLLAGFGVTAGAHRYFTHSSFKAHPFLRTILLGMFLMSGQGSILRWTRDHLIHHTFSDKDGDPHSPHDEGGFWHAQLWWLWKEPPTKREDTRLYLRFARRLARDPLVQTVHSGKFLLAFHIAVLALCFLLGCLIGGVFTGLSMVVWSVLGRVLVLHVTSLVNSATHLWGYRSYSTEEDSRNLWWVALLSLGEGWHNNHHRVPAAANNGFHRWWELDLSFLFILALASLGLVHDIRFYRADSDSLETWFVKENTI